MTPWGNSQTDYRAYLQTRRWSLAVSGVPVPARDDCSFCTSIKEGTRKANLFGKVHRSCPLCNKFGASSSTEVNTKRLSLDSKGKFDPSTGVLQLLFICWSPALFICQTLALYLLLLILSTFSLSADVDIHCSV